MITLTDARGAVRVLTEAAFLQERGVARRWDDRSLVPTRPRPKNWQAVVRGNRGTFTCRCGRTFTWKPGFHRHRNQCAA